MSTDYDEELYADFSLRFDEISVSKERYFAFLSDAKDELKESFYGSYHKKALQLHVANALTTLSPSHGPGSITQVTTGSLSKGFSSSVNSDFPSIYARELARLTRMICPLLVI